MDRIAAVLPAWEAGAGLSGARFHDMFFGPHDGDSLSDAAQDVGTALAAASSVTDPVMRTASERFAAFVQAARPEAMGRVMAAAQERAESPAAQDLVQVAAAKKAAAPAGKVAAPVSAEEAKKRAEKLRQENIANLARVMYNEARGYGIEAMTAVGFTLRNRMVRNGVDAVSSVWGGYSRAPIVFKKEHPEERGVYETARALAKDILDGKVPDPVNGATHFYSPQLMPKEGEAVGNSHVSTDLEQVPGVADKKGKPIRNYRPDWADSFNRVLTPDLPEQAYKFYRQPEQGKNRVR